MSVLPDPVSLTKSHKKCPLKLFAGGCCGKLRQRYLQKENKYDRIWYVDMISLEDTQLNIFAKRIEEEAKKWGTRKFWTCTKYLEFAQHPISPILVPHLCTPQTHSICPQLWSINFTWNCQLIPPIPTRPRPLVAPHRNFTQNMSNKNSCGPHNLKLIYEFRVHWNHGMCTLLIISTSRCSLRSIVPKCGRKPSPEPQISLFCLKFCTIPFST